MEELEESSIRKLISMGALSVDARDTKELTLLQIAVQNNHNLTVRLIIQVAYVFVTDAEDQAVLDLLLDYMDLRHAFEVMKLLLEKRATVNRSRDAMDDRLGREIFRYVKWAIPR